MKSYNKLFPNSNILCLMVGVATEVYPLFILPRSGISVHGMLLFGRYEGGPTQHHSYHSVGWIFSIGLIGIRMWNGGFMGGIFEIYIFPWSSIYLGAIDFTGIRIYIPEATIFIGTALWVKIQ